MSSDCIKCDKELSVYCGPCVDAIRKERDEVLAEVERLDARIKRIVASHVESMRLSVEAARREGAEAMREAAAQAALYYGNVTAAERIRALPLPGEEKP
jgi:outer membrane murein-binding lipoprotein Lpp